MSIARIALTGLLISFVARAAFAQPASLPPLSVAALFIAPSGQPFRSHPGEPYPVGKWFAAADANHDGKLDQAEFKAEALKFFQVLDQNRDGVIDDFEISAYEKQLVPEILSPELQGTNSVGPRGRTGAALGVQGQNTPSGDLDSGGEVLKPPREPGLDDGPAKGAAEFGLLNDAEPVRSADRRFDSRITAEEYGAQADRNFERLDGKGRGYLMLADLPTTPQQRDLTRHFRQK